MSTQIFCGPVGLRGRFQRWKQNQAHPMHLAMAARRGAKAVVTEPGCDHVAASSRPGEKEQVGDSTLLDLRRLPETLGSLAAVHRLGLLPRVGGHIRRRRSSGSGVEDVRWLMHNLADAAGHSG